MNYELLNVVDAASEIWQQVVERSQKNHHKILGIAASPYFARLVADQNLKGTSLLDYAMGRKYDLSQHIYFNDVPVPEMSAITMFPNGSIFVVKDGKPIARQFLYPNTRRVPQDVRYTNILDGSMDYVEEYSADGSVYSNIFYAYNDIQEIDFYNEKGEAVVRFYYFEGQINLVTIEDPKTHEVIKQYDNMLDFQQDQLSKLLKANDKVTINYLGIELDVLQKTVSHNILRLMEPPLDESGNVRGNLELILKDQIPWIKEVQMTLPEFQELSNAGMPMGKAKLV